MHSFLLSKQLETYFAEVVGLPVSQLSEKHFYALTELIFNLNKKILNLLASERLSSQDKEIEEKDSAAHMNDCGKRKVRYCGAWTVGKISRSCKKYVMSNIYSSNDEVRIKAKEGYITAELLSQLTWSSSCAQQQSNCKDTLNVTLLKNYDKGNLIHITDNMFQWILQLEQERVNLLDKRNLSIYQNELVEHVLTNITGNKELLKKWNELFSKDKVVSSIITVSVVQKLIDELFIQVIT